MKKFILGLLVASLGSVVYSQTFRGTPNNLRVTVDANGALVTSAVAQVAPTTSVQFTNARLAVDSNGALLVSGTVTAGSGTGVYNPPGVLFSESLATSTAADNLYVKTSTYQIPASTLATNQDMIVLDMVFLQSSEATDVRAYVCNWGFTAWDSSTGFTGGLNFMSNSTNNASVNIHVRGFLKRISSTTVTLYSESLVGGSYQNQAWFTNSTFDPAAAQNIACEVKNNDMTPVAGATLLKEFSVTYVPYHS